MKKNLAIILAGGSGNRISKELPKQFIPVAGKPIIAHTLDIFEHHPSIHHIYIVGHRDFRSRTETIVKTGNYKKVIKLLDGGPSRQESSYIGVMAANADEYENVLIHDAARPFVTHTIIHAILGALGQFKAVCVAVPSADTLIEIDQNNTIKSVPDRRFLRRVQTPQAFKLSYIRRAHQLALKQKVSDATDDCSLILKFQLSQIFVLEGSPMNIKITYPTDLQLATALLAEKTN